VSWAEVLNREWDRQDERARAGRCPVCGNPVMELLRVSGRLALANCPRCDAKNVKILLSPAAVRDAREPGLAA
jgi:hypothetical protein